MVSFYYIISLLCSNISYVCFAIFERCLTHKKSHSKTKNILKFDGLMRFIKSNMKYASNDNIGKIYLILDTKIVLIQHASVTKMDTVQYFLYTVSYVLLSELCPKLLLENPLSNMLFLVHPS